MKFPLSPHGYEESICEDTAGRWLSASQEVSSHQEPICGQCHLGLPSLQNCEKFLLFKPPSLHHSLWQPDQTSITEKHHAGCTMENGLEGTGIDIIDSLVRRPLNWDWIILLGFLGFQFTDNRLWDLASITGWAKGTLLRDAWLWDLQYLYYLKLMERLLCIYWKFDIGAFIFFPLNLKWKAIAMNDVNYVHYYPNEWQKSTMWRRNN